MELQGVRAGPRRRIAACRSRRAYGLVLAALLALALTAGSAAPAQALPVAFGAPPGPAVLVTSTTKPPAGDHLLAPAVERIAARNPLVIAALRRHRGQHLVAYEYTRGVGTWQVSWFTPPRPHTTQKEIIQVYISDATGQVTQIWTGYQIAWTMARGYPGAFGRKVNSLIVWLPLCVLFVLPFAPLPWLRRRASGVEDPPGRGGGGWVLTWRVRPSLLQLDLLMLLGFSVSLAFFNHANLGMSAPTIYPFMLYLVVRLLLLAFGRGIPRGPLRTLVPASWLVVALVFLVGFRIGLNVTNSNVIDVGYAGVIGANKVLYGQKLYGHWPSDNSQGDTYGPINYDAYVPFDVIFGWSGTWDDLPAAHAAAITFDLLTLLGLFLLGRAIRGPTLGVILAYLWAAYPFTLFTLCSNSNDSLVALMLVLTLLVMRWAPIRGVAAAFAGLTKFAPLLLAPLFLRGTGEAPSRRKVALFSGAFALAALAAMAPVLIKDNLVPFWHDTISYQIGRPAPFSIWGIWGGSYLNASNTLTVEQHLLEGAVVALAGAVMFVPRKRGLVEVAALAGALMIAFQMCLTYWFYLYIVWFFPLVIIALAGSHPLRPVDGRPDSTRGGERYPSRVAAPV